MNHTLPPLEGMAYWVDHGLVRRGSDGPVTIRPASLSTAAIHLSASARQASSLTATENALAGPRGSIRAIYHNPRTAWPAY